MQTRGHLQWLPPPPIRFSSVLQLPLQGIHSPKLTSFSKNALVLRLSNKAFNPSRRGLIRSSVAKEANQGAEQDQNQQLGVRRAYPFHEIEPKWQRFWDENSTFRIPDEIDTSKPKFYVLDMFPYPRYNYQFLSKIVFEKGREVFSFFEALQMEDVFKYLKKQLMIRNAQTFCFLGFQL